MSDKPILFSGPMVRAILEGRKTQTRRVVKPQLGLDDRGPRFCGVWEDWHGLRLQQPYLRGDRLWVRETWSYYEDAELFDCIRYKADGGVRKPKFDDFPGVSENVWYQFEMMCDGYGCADHKWRSPVCMPRWASRLTLEVTGVRVERLQEISEADAIAEGVDSISVAAIPRQAAWTHRQDFSRIWDSINKQHPWESNPWVWVYEFRRVET